MSYQIAQCRYSLIHITPRAKKRWFDKKKNQVLGLLSSESEFN